MIGDPILKKLEIENNPMEQKVPEVKLAKTKGGLQKSKETYVRKLHQEESEGWRFIEGHEKAGHWRDGKTQVSPSQLSML